MDSDVANRSLRLEDCDRRSATTNEATLPGLSIPIASTVEDDFKEGGYGW